MENRLRGKAWVFEGLLDVEIRIAVRQPEDMQLNRLMNSGRSSRN